jgi:hypothetical protein
MTQIVPLGAFLTSIRFIPLICGQMNLPKFKLIWDKTKSVIAEIGGPNGTNRPLFVFPNESLA